MKELNALRDVLYGLARALGWLNAALRGPGALARRTGRVAAWRAFGKTMGRWGR